MSGVVFQNIIAVANASQDFVFALLCALVGVFSVCVVTLSVVLAKRVNGDRKGLNDMFTGAKRRIKPTFVKIA